MSDLVLQSHPLVIRIDKRGFAVAGPADAAATRSAARANVNLP
jgi:hypothetical protein